MQDLARTIAENPFLQAVSIIVAIGTLFFFLAKTIPTTFRLIRDTLFYGLRVGLAKAARPAVKYARESFRDERLITLWTAHLTFRVLQAFVILIVMYVVIAIAIQIVALKEASASAAEEKFLDSVLQFGLWDAVMIPISLLAALYFYYPIYILNTYLRFTRRKVLRSLGIPKGSYVEPL